jgi:hypothetical protein
MHARLLYIHFLRREDYTWTVGGEGDVPVKVKSDKQLARVATNLGIGIVGLVVVRLIAQFLPMFHDAGWIVEDKLTVQAGTVIAVDALLLFVLVRFATEIRAYLLLRFPAVSSFGNMAASVVGLVITVIAYADFKPVTQAWPDVSNFYPQQLDQPQRGIHPPCAEASALGHLLNGRATISPDQGLFLTETRRLHPDVCRFTSEVFYDGRLLPRPENARQRLNASSALDGTGLRFASVEHAGNQNESPEEVESVGAMIEHLLQTRTTWSDKAGKVNALRPEDVLVVAPYNAQVSALAGRVPARTRVGTVDKFQGQEAPVVFYSMATSTPEDAPRGMEFLYSLNRLNVAVSRARCVAVIVASPALFQVQCKTPRQIELVNAFCRYLELARAA